MSGKKLKGPAERDVIINDNYNNIGCSRLSDVDG